MTLRNIKNIIRVYLKARKGRSVLPAKNAAAVIWDSLYRILKRA